MGIIVKNANIRTEVRSLKRDAQNPVESAAGEFSETGTYPDRDITANDDSEEANRAEKNPAGRDSKEIRNIDVVNGGKEVVIDGERYFRSDVSEEIVSEKEQWFNEQVDLAREKAAAQGYDEGYHKAKAEVEDEYKEAIEKLQGLFGSLDSAVSSKLIESEDLILEIIFTAVCRVIGKKLMEERTHSVEVIKNVLQEVGAESPFVLRLSELDYELVKELYSAGEFSSSFSVKKDSRIELGGCIIETQNGSFDGRLDVQLAHLRDIILGDAG